MIILDMDMPKSCGSCRRSGTDVCNEWTNLKGYDMGQKRADSCPIKCDIEDIKAEIAESMNTPKCCPFCETKMSEQTREMQFFSP